MNFSFLKDSSNFYELFAEACIDAERLYATSPEMCAVACRRALELAVKWVYAADKTINTPYRDNLASLIHEQTFKSSVDESVWKMLLAINKLGNLAVHTNQKIKSEDALLSLKCLFYFIDWIDYCYGPAYCERKFEEAKLPQQKLQFSNKQIAGFKKQGELVAKQEDQIKALEEKLQNVQEKLSKERTKNQESRQFNPQDIPEAETRKRYIDWDLSLAGWTLGSNVAQEREIFGMPTSNGKSTGQGFIDYVLYGKDGKPLAILEAKKTSYSPEKGLQQARLYAGCLQEESGYTPLIFLSNGFETYFVDDETSPKRKVSGVFSQDDMQRIINRRHNTCALTSVKVNNEIAGGGKNRYYQIEAIGQTCAAFDCGARKALLVMATGTGKTRVSAGLVDVLMRAGRVKNVLFLADRLALVSQAAKAYQKHLPQTSRCNLCSNKDERDARIVFSTYPTILNAIDTVRTNNNVRLYTPAHFDLIIVDEAHRSIFKKYKAIFEYFDALIVGLTATPANEVDRNTYDFFEVERGVPTYVYDYETATKKDHVLVPFLGIKTHTNFLDDGIKYADLTDADKQTLEQDFEEVGEDVPDFIANTQINSWVFNQATVDSVLQTLMECGIHVEGGQCLGKTIIFAQSQKHARFIVERFGKLYPKLPGNFIKTVLHSDDYSHTVIDEFELKDFPVITVSVDMLDTGIDVPQIVNLVFFKKVRSKIKFWQMIGRGTRLCAGLGVLDPLSTPQECADKQRFFIFDWCRNFEFFDENPKEVEGRLGTSLSEAVFCRQAQLVCELQQSAFAKDDYQTWRTGLVDEIHHQVVSLNEELFTVRQHRGAVEKFKQKQVYEFIDSTSLGELKSEIAPLVKNSENDTDALRFDALMYGFMCSLCDGISVSNYTRRLTAISVDLQQKTTIPQVKQKQKLLQEITEPNFFDEVSILKLEKLRQNLRGLMKFLSKDNKKNNVITHLDDPLTKIDYTTQAVPDETYDNYKLKVQRYMKDYKNSTVIQKLHKNIPMTKREFAELERIFTEELGSANDYEQTFGNTPFGLLVRKIVKLDRSCAMDAFADFINTQDLNTQQMSFVHKVVDYVVENGYIEPAVLNETPFDRPKSFLKMFDIKQQKKIIEVINSIKENAQNPAA